MSKPIDENSVFAELVWGGKGKIPHWWHFLGFNTRCFSIKKEPELPFHKEVGIPGLLFTIRSGGKELHIRPKLVNPHEKFNRVVYELSMVFVHPQDGEIKIVRLFNEHVLCAAFDIHMFNDDLAIFQNDFAKNNEADLGMEDNFIRKDSYMNFPVPSPTYSISILITELVKVMIGDLISMVTGIDMVLKHSNHLNRG